MDELITEAIDRMHTVIDILDYLANTRSQNGLCSILDHCSSQLQETINALGNFTDPPEA